MVERGSMRFLVDETSFELTETVAPGELESQLDRLVTLLQECRAREPKIFTWSKLLETEVCPGVLLCDILYSRMEKSPLDPDTCKSLGAALNRCVHWDDAVEDTPDFAVVIEGVPCQAPTAAFVRFLSTEKQGASCVCLGVRADRSGVLTVASGEHAERVHFITDPSAFPGFYRSLFELEDLDPDAYMENTRYAFPSLVFVPGLASQFSRFDTPYREIRSHVTSHLGVLNDHFQRVHREHRGVVAAIQAALRPHGVDANPESPKTHKNKAAMRQREVWVDGIRVSCEWHTKIKGHIDRIHFHPGQKDVAAGRLIVGIFTNHLDT